MSDEPLTRLTGPMLLTPGQVVARLEQMRKVWGMVALTKEGFVLQVMTLLEVAIGLPMRELFKIDGEPGSVSVEHLRANLTEEYAEAVTSAAITKIKELVG